MGEHLIEALRPAEALVPGVFESDGLFVVEHGSGAVANTLAVNDGLCGKFDVFGEQMPFPSAVFLEDFGGDKKAVPEIAQLVLRVRRAWLRYFASRRNQTAYPAEIQLLP